MDQKQKNENLRKSAKEGNLENVRIWIEKGANVNGKEYDGWTALMWASVKGHYDIVEYLVDSGANVNAISNKGETASMIASRKGYSDIVEYISENGIDGEYDEYDDDEDEELDESSLTIDESADEVSITNDKGKSVVINDASVDDLAKFLVNNLMTPAEIQKKVYDTYKSFRKQNPTMSEYEIKEELSKKCIDKYSTHTGISGVVTSLPSLIPGLGTAAMVGGIFADLGYMLKVQIEMVFYLATIYGKDVKDMDVRNSLMVLALCGVSSQGMQKVTTKLATTSFTKMTNMYLKGATLTTVKTLLKPIGVTFTRKAFVKAIPMGVGLVASFGINKVLTNFVGEQSHNFLKNE